MLGNQNVCLPEASMWPLLWFRVCWSGVSRVKVGIFQCQKCPPTNFFCCSVVSAIISFLLPTRPNTYNVANIWLGSYYYGNYQACFNPTILPSYTHEKKPFGCSWDRIPVLLLISLATNCIFLYTETY